MTDGDSGAGGGRRYAMRWFAGLVVVAILQMALSSPTIKPYDEGLILYGASRVAHGAAPYRDFWSMYGPGSFYVLGMLDTVFGESVLVGRCFDAAVRGALVTLVFALTRRRAGTLAAAGAAAVAFVLLASMRAYLMPAFPATACALLAMLLLERALGASSSSDDDSLPGANAWMRTGAAVGVTLLFRHDFGLGAALACLVVLPASTSGRARASSTGQRFGAFIGGAALVVVPALAALIWVVPASDVYEQLVTIPAAVYVAQRSLPFPSIVDAFRASIDHRVMAPLLSLVVYVAPLITGLGVVALWFARKRPTSRGPGARTTRHWLAALLVLDGLLCLKGAVRVELLHFVPALLVSLVLVANGIACFASPQTMRRVGVAAIAVVLAGGALAAARAALVRPGNGPAPVLFLADWRRCEGGPRLGCFVVDEAQRAVLAYLNRHAQPGDRLYVGTGRHDRLFINNVELYFLSGLPAATRWHDLHPGVQTTREMQATLIRELTARPPAFVVLNTAWDAHDEANLSRTSSGVTLLDDHLHAHFAPVFAAGTYSVWVSRGPGAPR